MHGYHLGWSHRSLVNTSGSRLSCTNGLCVHAFTCLTERNESDSVDITHMGIPWVMCFAPNNIRPVMRGGVTVWWTCTRFVVHRANFGVCENLWNGGPCGCRAEKGSLFQTWTLLHMDYSPAPVVSAQHAVIQPKC